MAKYKEGNQNTNSQTQGTKIMKFLNCKSNLSCNTYDKLTNTWSE